MNISPLVGNSYHSSSIISALLCCAGRFSCVRLCATLWTVAHQAPPAMGFSSQEHCSGLSCPLQGIFLTQGLNSGLLHCRWVPYHLSHQGSPPVSAPFLNFNSEFLMYFFHCHLRNLTSPLEFITSWRILMVLFYVSLAGLQSWSFNQTYV